MKITNQRIERLKQLLELEQRRSGLQQELDALTARMQTLHDSVYHGGSGDGESASPDSASGARRRGRPPKALVSLPATTPPKSTRGRKTRRKRGALKEQIFSALHAAGEAGVRVKELAQAFSINPVNIHSWFHSAISRHPEIKKVQGGHYRLSGSSSSTQQKNGQTPASSETRRGRGRPARGQATAKSGRAAAGGTKRSKPSRRGQLSSSILSELTAAGAKGIHVRDLSEKTGTPYKNIYIWFATTGKKNSKIKKIGPAHYKLS